MKGLILLACFLGVIAYYTMLERVLLGVVQRRYGPLKPRAVGLLTPLADSIKLITKHSLLPVNSKIGYSLAPYLLTAAMVVVLIYCISANLVFFQLCEFLCLIRLIPLPLFLVGYLRGRFYGLLGAARAVAQSLSYEVILAFVLVSLVYQTSTFHLQNYSLAAPEHLNNSIMVLFLLIVGLAETNRSPFDFVEGESELVSGFNVEYQGWQFALVFLSEYGIIVFFSLLMRRAFGLHCLGPLILLYYILIRSIIPRFRYDKLMNLCWLILLPSVLILFWLV